MDRLRAYSLLQLMAVASRSGVFATPSRRRGAVGAACRPDAGTPANVRPIAVADDPRGRPVILPYVVDNEPAATGAYSIAPGTFRRRATRDT